MKIPIKVRQLIEAGTPAHLTTLNPDGSPQITIVWVGLDGEEIVVAHLPKNRKVKNIMRDGRVAISLQANSKNQIGLTEYVVLYGTARIEEGGAAELLQKLAWVYMGPDVKFPPMDDPPSGYITRITVKRISGVGTWEDN